MAFSSKAPPFVNCAHGRTLCYFLQWPVSTATRALHFGSEAGQPHYKAIGVKEERLLAMLL
jgi:hypothetical protein